MARKIKLLLLDIDGVLTVPLVGLEEERAKNMALHEAINPKAISRIARYAKKGYKIAFITGRGAQMLEHDFLPLLKKEGLFEDSLIFVESGLMEFSRGKRQVTPYGRAFLEKRAALKQAILTEAQGRGLSIENLMERKEVMFTFRPDPKRGISSELIGEIITKAAQSRPDFKELVRIDIKPGAVDAYPPGAGKGTAAKLVFQRFGIKQGETRYVARSFGDAPSDREMAIGREAKHTHITNGSRGFLRKTRELDIRMRAQALHTSFLRLANKFRKRKPK